MFCAFDIINSICFGSGHDAHVGYMYIMYCYTSQPDDVTDIANHVTVQLPTAARLHTKSPVFAGVDVPACMDVKALGVELKRIIGLQSSEKTMYSPTLFVHEQVREPGSKL